VPAACQEKAESPHGAQMGRVCSQRVVLKRRMSAERLASEGSDRRLHDYRSTSTEYRNCGARAWPDHRFRENSASAPASIGSGVFPSTLAASRKALVRYARASEVAVLAGSMYVRARLPQPPSRDGDPPYPVCVGVRSARSRPRFIVGALPSMMPASPAAPLADSRIRQTRSA
jgi:hypothetical protein